MITTQNLYAKPDRFGKIEVEPVTNPDPMKEVMTVSPSPPKKGVKGFPKLKDLKDILNELLECFTPNNRIHNLVLDGLDALNGHPRSRT